MILDDDQINGIDMVKRSIYHVCLHARGNTNTNQIIVESCVNHASLNII
jgi:hypothetical protein